MTAMKWKQKRIQKRIRENYTWKMWPDLCAKSISWNAYAINAGIHVILFSLETDWTADH